MTTTTTTTTTTTVLTLYHVPRTISSPILQYLLEADLVVTANNNNDTTNTKTNSNQAKVHVVERSFVQLKSPEHLAINPMGTSPAFTFQDIVIWESGAILDYLLETYDTNYTWHPAPITPSSTSIQRTRRAHYLQWKQYILATVYPFVASLYIHTLKPINEQDSAYLEQATIKWKTVLGPILTQWLLQGGGTYCLGGKMSVIDLLLAKPLSNIHAMGLFVKNNNNNNNNQQGNAFVELQTLFETISSRPTFAQAYEPSNLTKDKTETDPQQRSIVMVPSKKS